MGKDRLVIASKHVEEQIHCTEKLQPATRIGSLIPFLKSRLMPLQDLSIQKMGGIENPFNKIITQDYRPVSILIYTNAWNFLINITDVNLLTIINNNINIELYNNSKPNIKKLLKVPFGTLMYNDKV